MADYESEKGSGVLEEDEKYFQEELLGKEADRPAYDEEAERRERRGKAYGPLGSIQKYLLDLRKIPLLSAEEEKEIGSAIEASKKAIKPAITSLPRYLALKSEAGKKEDDDPERFEDPENPCDEAEDAADEAFETCLKELAEAMDRLSQNRLALAADKEGNGTRTALMERENELCRQMEDKFGFPILALEEMWQSIAPQVARLNEKKDELLKGNLRLVIDYAKKMANCGMPMGDIVQEGNIGLMTAVDKFKSKKGFKFSTYAYWWIRQKIIRALHDKGRTVRLPAHISQELNDIARIEHRIKGEYDLDPSVDMIAKMKGYSAKKVERLLKHRGAILSLDDTMKDDSNTTFGDMLPDNYNLRPDQLAENKSFARFIQRVLVSAGLTTKEKGIICSRFGLLDGRERTLEEVGKRFGFSRERARQIESGALQKIKRAVERRGLKKC